MDEDDSGGAPAGVMPLFFSVATQEIYGCRAGEDVTSEAPWILVPKSKILEDYRNRAAISDLHPAKQMILPYPDDQEILFVYDDDYVYGQNFFICVTVEARDAYLKRGEEEAVVDEDESTDEMVVGPDGERKPKRPQEWLCLGSDLEMEEAKVVPQRPLIKCIFSRKRREFGASYKFEDRDESIPSDEMTTYRPYEDPSFSLHQMQHHVGVQAVPVVTNNACQTSNFRVSNSATQYTPQAFDTEELADAMATDGLAAFLKEVLPLVERALQINETFDIFEDDCRILADDDSALGNKADNYMKEYQSFTDLKYSKDKCITAIDWHPNVPGLVGVACVDKLTFDDRIAKSSQVLRAQALILIWSFSDPIHPQLILEAPDDVSAFHFNPSMPNIVAAGCVNGQLVLWDLVEYAERLDMQLARKARDNTVNSFFLGGPEDGTSIGAGNKEVPIVRYQIVSSIESSHRNLVNQIHWLPDHVEVNRTGIIVANTQPISHQLITVAPDGMVLFWDMHQKQTIQQLDLAWKPLFKALLIHPDVAHEYGGLCVSVNLDKQIDGLQGGTTGAGAATGDDEEATIDDESAGLGAGNVGDGMGASVANGKEPDGSAAPVTDDGNAALEKRKSRNVGSDLKRSTSVFLRPGSSGIADKVHRPILESYTSNFFAGTESGEVCYADWRVNRDADTHKQKHVQFQHVSQCHSGPVLAIERSPFFSDIVLTVGGWSFAVWKEGCYLGPLLMSPCIAGRMTAAAWSPTRPGVFYIAKSDGGVDVWDILDRSHEPSLSQNISSSGIKSMRASAAPSPVAIAAAAKEKGKPLHFLAIGDSSGTLHIVEIPRNLWRPSANEFVVIEGFFEREVLRLQYAQTHQYVRHPVTVTETSETEKKDDDENQDLDEEAEKEYRKFLELERSFLEELGIEKDELDN